MQKESREVVYAHMTARCRTNWDAQEKGPSFIQRKRQLRYIALSSAAFLCLGAGVYQLANRGEPAIHVMNQITTDFEYDETLGRLQFVSNMLPESAMVFLQNDEISMQRPTDAEETHAWSPEEPWIEYQGTGDVTACSDAMVMAVIKNREDAYTVRLMHEGGYESIYSGLMNVKLEESDLVYSGEPIGCAARTTGFEVRRDGLSVCPVFAATE